MRRTRRWILIKQLVAFEPDRQYIIGNNQMGSFLNLSDALDGRCQQYEAVFLLHPEGEHSIEAGTYLSVCYSGSFRQTRRFVPQLLQYARDHGMAACEPLLELLWIDNHTTKHVEEQVTELQLKVELA